MKNARGTISIHLGAYEASTHLDHDSLHLRPDDMSYVRKASAAERVPSIVRARYSLLSSRTPIVCCSEGGIVVVGFGVGSEWLRRDIVVHPCSVVASRPGYIVARGAEAVVAGLLVGSSWFLFEKSSSFFVRVASCVPIRIAPAPASSVLGAHAQRRHLEVVAAARIAVSVHGRRVYEGKPK